MWIAVTACASAPEWTTRSAPRPISVFDAPPLAGASYVATVDQGDFGHPGPYVSFERGSRSCKQLDTPQCAPLRSIGGVIFVDDRWLSAADVIAKAVPIDSPQKALLVAWVSGFHGVWTIDWTDGKASYGSVDDGHVRAVGGGYEVAVGTSTYDQECGGNESRETVTNHRVIVFVDRAGNVRERERVATHSYKVADPCHPMGRRPEDFVDVSASGWARAMHHEAESVRAFERLARELAHYDAPIELLEAARRAAREEIDHAQRCATMANTTVTIACDDLPIRPLVEVAIDNAREGCVGESYAALAAIMQARTEGDPIARAHLIAIATDELGHAALSHAIADWIDAQLSPADRAIVAVTRAAALADLRAARPNDPLVAAMI